VKKSKRILAAVAAFAVAAFAGCGGTDEDLGPTFYLDYVVLAGVPFFCVYECGVECGHDHREDNVSFIELTASGFRGMGLAVENGLLNPENEKTRVSTIPPGEDYITDVKIEFFPDVNQMMVLAAQGEAWQGRMPDPVRASVRSPIRVMFILYRHQNNPLGNMNTRSLGFNPDDIEYDDDGRRFLTLQWRN